MPELDFTENRNSSIALKTSYVLNFTLSSLEGQNWPDAVPEDEILLQGYPSPPPGRGKWPEFSAPEVLLNFLKINIKKQIIVTVFLFSNTVGIRKLDKSGF